jgi:hypothetical protein
LSSAARTPTSPFRRQVCTLGARYGPLATRELLRSAGTICNISCAGLAVIGDAALLPGTKLLIQIQGPTRQLSPTLRAQVAHATIQTDGSWILGCSLATPLSTDLLKALLSLQPRP